MAENLLMNIYTYYYSYIVILSMNITNNIHLKKPKIAWHEYKKYAKYDTKNNKYNSIKEKDE